MFLAQKLIKIIHTIFNKIKLGISSHLEDLSAIPDNFYNPKIPNHHFVIVEHRGFQFVGRVINYELGNGLNSKMCYFTEDYHKPFTLLTTKNMQHILGDARSHIVSNADMILKIAEITKCRSFMVLVNVLRMLKSNQTIDSFDTEHIKKCYKIHMYRMNMLSNSWIN